jgi:hypothetical protein
MLENSRIAEQLMACEEALGSMESDIALNSVHCGNAILRQCWSYYERLWLHRSGTSASVDRMIVHSRCKDRSEYVKTPLQTMM